MLLLQEAVADYLQSSGVGSIGVTVFLGQLPSSPVGAIAVVGRGGAGNPTAPMEIRNSDVQILCRDGKYTTAANSAELVFRSVAGKWNLTSALQGRMNPDHAVGPKYRDSNNNHVFTLNFSLLTVSTTI